MTNSIMSIIPYKENGQWMFDDLSVGLIREAFVSGADEIMDAISSAFENGDKGFILIFSSSPFPDYQFKAEWVREEFDGNWYFSEDLNIEGWLCPALFKYFDEAPKSIYFKAKELKDHLRKF